MVNIVSGLLMPLLLLGAGPMDRPDSLPDLPWHLTARPWTPLNTPREAYLDTVEGMCRFAAAHVNDDGAFIDPVINKEHQYATPYFAFAAGLLFHEGRAMDLLPAGTRAMEHATACLAGGREAIPDGHGEFFLAPLTGALELYADHVPAETLARWRKRMQTPLENIIAGPGERINNWRTYAMKGEWLRARALLTERSKALDFIRDAWFNRTQRERVAPDKWNLYQDWSSDPQSLAVEAVGRGNLLGMIAAGYDGALRNSLSKMVQRGTATTLLLQDPTGQAPPNGRTDNHVFNDVLYLLCFEAMAESLGESNVHQAGRYRRAARLAFESSQRWRREDESWAGSFYVTKNHFDPEKRIGYQPASQYSNYNGAVMYHLAEAYLAASREIAETPAPAEIGGYTLVTDAAFSTVAANAGGMQILANLRGDTIPKYNTYWTPLGVIRFSRAGWESRLGPIDGIYDGRERSGITFAPVWKEGSKWRRLSEMAEHYRGTFICDSAHPLIVRCHILYHSVTGAGGPSFRHDFIITPHLIVSTLSSPDAGEYGVTLPVLADDGRPLEIAHSDHLVATGYGENGDQQCFMVTGEKAVIGEGGEALLSTGGLLKPFRAVNPDGPVTVLIYPRNPGEAEAAAVLEGFRITEKGFTSSVGSLDGTLFRGPFSAGGYGKSMDINGDGADDLVFAKNCRFMLTHEKGVVTAIEADQVVQVDMGGAIHELHPYSPLTIESAGK